MFTLGKCSHKFEIDEEEDEDFCSALTCRSLENKHELTEPLYCWWLIWPIQNDAKMPRILLKPWHMGTYLKVLNEQTLCFHVLWIKVASALEGLNPNHTIIFSFREAAYFCPASNRLLKLIFVERHSTQQRPLLCP